MNNKRKSRTPSCQTPKKAKTMSKENKLFAASVALQLEAAGLKQGRIYDILNASGYTGSRRSLRRHVANVNQRGTPFKETNNAGPPKALSELQEHLLCGFILHNNIEQKKVTRTAVYEFVTETLGVQCTLRTVGNYIDKNGFSLKKLQAKPGNAVRPHYELVDMYSQFIKTLRRDAATKGLLGAIDFTYTSHRNVTERGYSPKGMIIRTLTNTLTTFLGWKHATFKKNLSKYTNCIATLVTSDGVNHYPAMLFSHNPAFSGVNTGTAASKRKKAKLIDTAKRYGIELNRICYIDNTHTKYCKESYTITNMVMEHYRPHHIDIMFSDQGNAFKTGDDTIIGDLHHYRYYQFPPAVHQFLSVNDNNLHGAAKKVWRQKIQDFSDDVEASLCLLACLDAVKREAIKAWWCRNMFLDGRSLSDEAISRIIKGPDPKRQEYYASCVIEYRKEILKEKIDPTRAVESMMGDLDGTYWE